MLSHYLVYTKVLNFTVYQEKLRKILSELCRISINLITFGKIAETLCSVHKVYPVPRTQALRRRRHWPIAACIHDQLVKACLLVDQTCFKFVDVSYSGWVNFLLQYTPGAILDWVQIR